MPHLMIVSIPYIFILLNLSRIIKCLFLRNMDSLKQRYDIYYSFNSIIHGTMSVIKDIVFVL